MKLQIYAPGITYKRFHREYYQSNENKQALYPDYPDAVFRLEFDIYKCRNETKRGLAISEKKLAISEKISSLY